MHEAGILRSGESLAVGQTSRVFDLGNGLTIGICFSEEDERKFREAQGVLRTFSGRANTSTQLQHFSQPEGMRAPEMEEGGVFAGQSRRSRKPTQVLNEVVSMYNQASNTGRVVLLTFAVVMALVLAVIVNLLLPVLYR